MCAYRSRRRLFLESLETRNLLAAAVGTVALDEGVLSIVGSKKNDKIEVAATESLLTVRLNKQVFEFSAAEVSEIHVDGGNGNDWICVDGSVLVGATINGGAGNDHVFGGGGDDTISGDKGNDKVHGGGGNDVMHGNEGHDHVHGGAGEDELFGDGGFDKLDGGEDDDVLSGGLGKDHLNGGAGDDELFGDEGLDHLWGGEGDDELFGGDGHDHLAGGLGDDRLKGEAGNDHLNGNEGVNLLDGDEGRNKFKNGTVVDLDVQVEEWETILIAHLTDQSGSGMVGEALYQVSGTDDELVHRLVVTVSGVPAGTPSPLMLVVGEAILGYITVDPVTGEGSLIVFNNDIEAGYFVGVGMNLVGQFVAV